MKLYKNINYDQLKIDIIEYQRINNLNNKELSEILGCSQWSIIDWKKGYSYPSKPYILKLLDAKVIKKIKIEGKNKDSKNGNWKDDAVGYTGIHNWAKRRIHKPTICEICHEIKKLDLANISQEYKRDIRDWEWICRRCHMQKDGRINKLIKRISEQNIKWGKNKTHPRRVKK